jgi:uncharacterized membrane protein
MMRALVTGLALLFWLAQACWAFDLPALYRVIDVAEDDVLNVRTEPTVQSAITGELLHNESGVEVVALSDNGRWGRVNVGETSGWAAMRFLQPINTPTRPLRAECFGTEPFWSLSLGATHIFREPQNSSLPYRATAELTSPSNTNSIAILGHNPQSRMVATVDATQCSDGMSDRAYGLSIGLVLTGGDDPRYLTGCCSLAP